MIIKFDTKGNVKQKEAAAAWLDQTTEHILYGGAKYGGKSYLGCSLIFGDALIYPGTSYFIARNALTDLRKYTIPSVYEVFEHWGLNPRKYFTYNGQDNYFDLSNQSRVYFLDAAYLPSDPDFHRFGSIQMTRGWCEEIGQMHPKAISMLYLTVGRWRNDRYGLKKKMLSTCNPHKSYGYHEFYLPAKNRNLPPEKKFIVALPQDNKAGDPDYIESLRTNPNKNERERLYYGNWEYDDDPSVLMDFQTITDLFTNTGTPGEKYVIGDVARKGRDRMVIGYWEGMQLIEVHELADEVKHDTVKAANWIKEFLAKKQVRLSHCLLDEEGVGGGVVDILECEGFIGGSAQIQPHEAKWDESKKVNYANLRSQCAFRFAQLAARGEIGLSVEDVAIKTIITQELEQLKRKNMDKDGKIALIGKDVIKEAIGRSPDYADMLTMRMYFNLHDKVKPSIEIIE